MFVPAILSPSRRGKRTRQGTSLYKPGRGGEGGEGEGTFSALRHRCLPVSAAQFMRDIKRGDDVQKPNDREHDTQRIYEDIIRRDRDGNKYYRYG